MENTNQYMSDFVNLSSALAQKKIKDADGDEAPLYSPTGYFNTNKTNQSVQNYTNAMNYVMNAENNAANLALAREQNAFNRKQWEDTNEYNSPAEQFKRLTDAGMSMAAAAAAVGNFEAQPIQSADLANQEAAKMDAFRAQPVDIQGIMGIGDNIIGKMRQMLEMKSLSQQIENQQNELDFQRPNLFNRNEAQQYEARLKTAEWQRYIAESPYHIRSTEYKAMADEKEPELKQAEINRVNAERELIQGNANLVSQKFEFLSKMNDKEFEKLQEEINSILLSQEEARARIAEINSRTDLNVEQKNTEIAKQHLLSKDEEAKEIENTFAKFGSPTDVASRTAVMLTSGKISEQDLWKNWGNIKFNISKGHQFFNEGIDSDLTLPYLHFIFDEGESKMWQLNASQLGYPTFISNEVNRQVTGRNIVK